MGSIELAGLPDDYDIRLLLLLHPVYRVFRHFAFCHTLVDHLSHHKHSNRRGSPKGLAGSLCGLVDRWRECFWWSWV